MPDEKDKEQTQQPSERRADTPQAPSILDADVPDAGPSPDPNSPKHGEGSDEPGETDQEREADGDDRRRVRMVIGADAPPPRTGRAPSAASASKAEDESAAPRTSKEAVRAVKPLDKEPDALYVVVTRGVQLEGEQRPNGEVLVIGDKRKREVLVRARRVREIDRGDSIHLSPDGRMWATREMAEQYAVNALG